MKKRLLFFASFALLFLFSCGNQETAKTEKPYLLKVKMKETDCFRCVSGQITMRDLSDVADVEIVSLKLALPDVVKYLTKDNKVGTLVLEY